MTHYDIVKKLIGPIKPVGSTEIDTERFANLEVTINLVDLLLIEIESVANMIDRPEYSVKKAAEFANTYLKGIDFKAS